MSRTRPELRAESRLSPRQRSEAGTRPNFLSLVIALGVIGLLVWLFPMDWLRAPSVSVQLDRSAFSPDGNGSQDEVAAFYTLSEPAKVTAVIENSAGLAVRRLVGEQDQSDGQHAITWDGRDDSGQRVADGLYRLVITAAATARRSDHSTPIEVDTRPPTLQLANFSDNLTTRNPTLTIEGQSEPNSTIWISGDPRPVSVDARGIFRVQRTLEEGITPLDIRAVDAAGNEAMLSRTVTLRTRPPELTLSAPAENNAFVSNNLVSVTGRVPPDVTVTVNDREATVSEQGDFALDLVLDEGENVLRVVATDEVGNKSELERRITLSSQGPVITLTSVSDGMTVRDPSLRISGKVDPGSTLRVNGDTVPVDANGNFSTLVALQGGNNLITVTATDLAGNATTVQRTVHYATASNPGPRTTPQIALPSLPSGPLFWRVLIGVGLVGAALFLFGGYASPITFDLSVDHPTFYPNRPNDQRILVLRMALSRAAAVDIEILDERHRPVMTLVSNRRHGAGEHFRLWDGRSAANQSLPSGSYLIQARARTATNQATASVWVRVDTSRNTTTARRRHWMQDDPVTVGER